MPSIATVVVLPLVPVTKTNPFGIAPSIRSRARGLILRPMSPGRADPPPARSAFAVRPAVFPAQAASRSRSVSTRQLCY